METFAADGARRAARAGSADRRRGVTAARVAPAPRTSGAAVMKAIGAIATTRDGRGGGEGGGRHGAEKEHLTLPEGDG